MACEFKAPACLQKHRQIGISLQRHSLDERCKLTRGIRDRELSSSTAVLHWQEHWQELCLL